MYKIEKENLEALFRKIAESQDLILPIKKAGQTNFGLWSEGEEADSCFLSEPVDVSKYGIIYGGVQKNIGLPGPVFVAGLWLLM